MVAVLSLIPLTAGCFGALQGLAFVDPVGNASADSHFRYLSGLLLGIGFGFWSTVPAIEARTERFRLLTFIVFVGGLARAVGLWRLGVPSWPMLGGQAMELVVTPLLCLWQARIAKMDL